MFFICNDRTWVKRTWNRQQLWNRIVKITKHQHQYPSQRDWFPFFEMFIYLDVFLGCTSAPQNRSFLTQLCRIGVFSDDSGLLMHLLNKSVSCILSSAGKWNLVDDIFSHFWMLWKWSWMFANLCTFEAKSGKRRQNWWNQMKTKMKDRTLKFHGSETYFQI